MSANPPEEYQIKCPQCRTDKFVYHEDRYMGQPACRMGCDGCHIVWMLGPEANKCDGCNYRIDCLVDCN
jgi:hypothetical protein